MILKSFVDNVSEPVSHNHNIQKKVLVRRGDVANIMRMARSIFPPGEVADAHSHSDMYELFMARPGVGQFTIDGTLHELHKDSCIIIEPGESHIVENIGSEDLVLDYFGLQSV